jgi:hypothetical protein
MERQVTRVIADMIGNETIGAVLIAAQPQFPAGDSGMTTAEVVSTPLSWRCWTPGQRALHAGVSGAWLRV